MYYKSSDTLLGVSVSTAPHLAVGKPEVVYKGRSWNSNLAGPNYAVAPDGKRFLMLESDEQAELTQIHVALNWTTQFKK